MDNYAHLPPEEFYKQNPLTRQSDQFLKELNQALLNEPSELDITEMTKRFIETFFKLTIHFKSRQNSSFINALSKYLLKIKRLQLMNLIMSFYIFIHSVIEEIEKEYSTMPADMDFYYQSDFILTPIISYSNNDINNLELNITSTSMKKLQYLTSLLEFTLNTQQNDPFLTFHLIYGHYPDGQTLSIKHKITTLTTKSFDDSDIKWEKYTVDQLVERKNYILSTALVTCENEIKQNFHFTKRHTKFFRLTYEKVKQKIMGIEGIESHIEMIIPFGSVTQCTQNIKSDLEITVITKEDTDEDMIHSMIHTAVLDDNDNYTNVAFRPTKRTNLIIFEDIKNKVKVELNLNNKFGVLNSTLIRNYLLSDSRALIMVNTIKDWSKNFEVNGNHRSYLSSYCFTLMLIYFLQRVDPPVLPIITSKNNLVSMHVLSHHYHIEEALVTEFNFTKSENNDSISVLLLKFFLFYYAIFNEEDYCIDITSKEEIIRYYDISYLNYFKDKNSKRSVYCIIDPFDYSYNPAAYFELNTSSHVRFKKILRLTIDNILQGKPFLKPNPSDDLD